MEVVSLDRYEITGILGSGADYEVRSARDRETGREVVLKRPVPQTISRQFHGPTEQRTDRTLQAYREVGHDIPALIPLLGYTERANHDGFYGESYGQEYRVMVEERARGIPLVGDVRARILRVPIGLGQNLFALFPLTHPEGQPPFAIHQQLLDVEEKFFASGYILLDLMPQNVFYQPDAGAITIIDCGSLISREGQPGPRGRAPQDIHDCYLEILKFYTTPQEPPGQVNGYRDPYGMRPTVNFEQDLDEMARAFGDGSAPARNEALYLINKVRDRGYTDLESFRQDLTAYLEAVRIRNQKLPNLSEAREAWAAALSLLRENHWRKYVFDPEADLAGLGGFDGAQPPQGSV